MQPIWSDLSILIPLWNTRIHLGWYRLSQPRVVLIKNLSNLSARPGMSIRRDWQSQAFLSKGLESQSSESRDCPNDFFPSPKSPMGHRFQKIPIVPMRLKNPKGLESQLVPKLEFGCARDSCAGTVPAIFFPVSSVPRESVPSLRI